jgi:cytochrome b561
MSGAYHPAQRALHWAVAAAVALAAPLGIAIADMTDAEVRGLTGGGLGIGDLYWWHKSFGFLVLTLMLVRVAARLRLGEPPHDPPLARHQRIASHAVHMLLYVLLIALPLLGWYGTSLYGPGVANFFALTMPDLASQDREMSKTVLYIHGSVGMIVLGLIALHLGGAAFHGWIKRDGVVQRMTGGARDDR